VREPTGRNVKKVSRSKLKCVSLEQPEWSESNKVPANGEQPALRGPKPRCHDRDSAFWQGNVRVIDWYMDDSTHPNQVTNYCTGELRMSGLAPITLRPNSVQSGWLLQSRAHLKVEDHSLGEAKI